jgi:hypothetical protein
MMHEFFIVVLIALNLAAKAAALPDIQPLLEQLATNPHQPNLWRRLGKLQLDAGEFSEARRIFCFGSECCPSDKQLQHHVKVFQAFHTTPTSDEEASSTSLDHHPPLESPAAPEFLSLEVPPHAIPESVRKHPSTLVPPDQRTRLIHASQHPIIPKEACQYLIQAAKQTTERIGWTKDRHIQAPTCDVPVFDLAPPARQWVRQAFHNVISPLLCQVVGPELGDIQPSDLRVQDCFIVRYDALAKDDDNNDDEDNNPGFHSLKPHQDESLLSLTIALNDMDQDYQEGGLYVASTQDVLNGPAGTVLCFAGGLVHGGYPVTQGTRWILTVFLYVDSNQSTKTPGYTLEALKRLKQRAGENPKQTNNESR